MFLSNTLPDSLSKKKPYQIQNQKNTLPDWNICSYWGRATYKQGPPQSNNETRVKDAN